MTIWITCQLGAREHYAIPRALHETGKLLTLITDAWVPRYSPFHYLPGKVSRFLNDRYHSDLRAASVKAFTLSLVRFELQQRLAHADGWSAILARNHWFQENALQILQKIKAQLPANSLPILFSYSYTALDLFRYAKQQGWTTVLGQIDPGFIEEKLVSQLQSLYGKQYHSTWASAPANYWHSWRQECQLADNIIVNSLWSRQLLIEAGILPEKIKIIPLVYSPPPEAQTFQRHYPERFSPTRPLRVLFLGQIILRKGLASIFEAICLLEDFPIQFIFIGSSQIFIPKEYQNHPKIKWLGKMPRSQTNLYYQMSDVFLFPSLSDGFGLTQLEAQAWQLPIIASRHCGCVVENEVNGLILPSVTPKHIADSIQFCLKSPKKLKEFALSCKQLSNNFTLKTLSTFLGNLE